MLFGDLLVIPIENSFLYVQPAYVRADQPAAVPELKFVVVVNGDRVAVADNLDDALTQAVEGVDTGGEEPPDGGTGTDQTVAELLEEAASHFDAADEALRAGDLATYQREIDAAQDLVAQAIELSGAEPADVATSPSPSPSASPVARLPGAPVQSSAGTPGPRRRRRRPSAPSAGGPSSPSSWPASA